MITSVWVKSSHSGYNGDCVEATQDAGSVLVRDSKHPDGPRLAFTPAEWRTFLASVPYCSGQSSRGRTLDPRRGTVSSHPSSARSSIARRTVPRLSECNCIRVVSDGMA